MFGNIYRRKQLKGEEYPCSKKVHQKSMNKIVQNYIQKCVDYETYFAYNNFDGYVYRYR